MMHRIKFASLLALLIMLGALCVPSKANAACTAATIGNTYGFHFHGLAGPAANHHLMHITTRGVGWPER